GGGDGERARRVIGSVDTIETDSTRDGGGIIIREGKPARSCQRKSISGCRIDAETGCGRDGKRRSAQSLRRGQRSAAGISAAGPGAGGIGAPHIAAIAANEGAGRKGCSQDQALAQAG